MAVVPSIQFAQFIGGDPANGIVFARRADTSLKAVLGYTEGSDTAFVNASLALTPAASAQAMYLVNAQNASANALAQAIVLAQTASVQVALGATNGSGGSVYVGSVTAHALDLITGGVRRARVTTAGEFLVGTNPPAGSERVRVEGALRLTGNLFVGGGQMLTLDDGGTQRWASGVVGGAGERRWSVYDAVNGRYALVLTDTTGTASFPNGLRDGFTLRAESGVGTSAVFANAAGGARYLLGMDASPETAGMADGSYFYLNAYDNTGAFWDRPMFYSRASQTWVFSNDLILSGALSATGIKRPNGVTVMDVASARVRLSDTNGNLRFATDNSPFLLNTFYGQGHVFGAPDGSHIYASFDNQAAANATDTGLVLRLNGADRRAAVKAGNTLTASDLVMVLQ